MRVLRFGFVPLTGISIVTGLVLFSQNIEAAASGEPLIRRTRTKGGKNF